MLQFKILSCQQHVDFRHEGPVTIFAQPCLLDNNSRYLFIWLSLLFLDTDDLIVTHSRKDGDRVGNITSILELLSNFATKVIWVLWELDIFTGFAALIHQGDESIFRDINQGIFLILDERNISVVGGRNDIFVLLASENINCSKVALSVTVFASLGSGNSSNFARESFDADIAEIKTKYP